MVTHSAKLTEVGGNIVDVAKRRIFPGTVRVENGRIAEVVEGGGPFEQFILPGFVDAHIHIESSMLIPSEFSRMAVVHGTVATVSDPHEIANVLGVAGVRFMLEDAARAAGGVKILFGAPPCVPATTFETAGGMLGVEEIRTLLADPRIGYLAEVMNYPGVIAGDPDLLAKIQCAMDAGKPIDGHAPGLRGQGVSAYFSRGISTDHECFILDEALEKLAAAPHLHILMREGSAAKNFDALHSLLRTHPQRVMFCSDDKHPNDLEEGHINRLVARAIGLGYDLFDVLQAACVNPVTHYRLPVGLLRADDPADFVEVRDLVRFEVLRTVINGQVVAENGRCVFAAPSRSGVMPNLFNARPKQPADFEVRAGISRSRANVIEVEDGQLITSRVVEEVPVAKGVVQAAPHRDILKICVINRYAPDAKPAAAFVRGFGMKRGAIASSVAHDSHNIVAVGVDDESIARAVNLVIGSRGGLAAADGTQGDLLPLPVGGIMTDQPGISVARAYRRIDALAREFCDGRALIAPFMTLSFLALLVIPSLKLSDKGLFDAASFHFIDVLEPEEG